MKNGLMHKSQVPKKTQCATVTGVTEKCKRSLYTIVLVILIHHAELALTLNSVVLNVTLQIYKHRMKPLCHLLTTACTLPCLFLATAFKSNGKSVLFFITVMFLWAATQFLIDVSGDEQKP